MLVKVEIKLQDEKKLNEVGRCGLFNLDMNTIFMFKLKLAMKMVTQNLGGLQREVTVTERNSTLTQGTCCRVLRTKYAAQFCWLLSLYQTCHEIMRASVYMDLNNWKYQANQ